MRRPSTFVIGYEGYAQGSETIAELERSGFVFDSSSIDFKNKFYGQQPDDYIVNCNCIVVDVSKKFWLLEEESSAEKLIAVNFLGVPSNEELKNLYNFYFSFFEYSHNSHNNYHSNYIKVDKRVGIRYKIYNEKDYKTIEDDFILISTNEDRNTLEIIDTKEVYIQSRLVAPPTGFRYYNTYQAITKGKICSFLEEDQDTKRRTSVCKLEDGIYLEGNKFAYCYKHRDIQIVDIEEEIDTYRSRYMMDEREISYFDPFIYGGFLEFKLKF